MRYIPLASQSLPAEYNGERALNYQPCQTESPAGLVLKARGGLVERHSFNGVQAVDRRENQNLLYLVSEGRLFSVTNDFSVSPVDLATIPGAENATQIELAAGPNAVAIVVDGTYHYWNGSVLSQPSVGALTTVYGVEFHSNYFVPYGEASGRRDAFQPSAVNNGASFDGTDVQFAEEAGDRIKRVISHQGYLWIFGGSTIEAYRLSTLSNPVFSRSLGNTISRGCKDGATVAADEAAIYWLGNDGRVYRLMGGVPQRIGTPELESELRQIPPTAGFTFSDRGQAHYALVRDGGTTLTRATTWCFDRDLLRWHERSTGLFNEENTRQFVPNFRGFGEDTWAAQIATERDGVQWLAGPKGLATIDESTATDFGDEIIQFEAITPPVVQGGQRLEISRLSVLMNTGFASADGILRMYHAERRRVWQKVQEASIGALADYNRQVWFNRPIGAVRYGQFRFVVTDPVNADIHGIAYE